MKNEGVAILFKQFVWTNCGNCAAADYHVCFWSAMKGFSTCTPDVTRLTTDFEIAIDSTVNRLSHEIRFFAKVSELGRIALVV